MKIEVKVTPKLLHPPSGHLFPLTEVYIIALASWVQGTFAVLRAAWWVAPSDAMAMAFNHFMPNFASPALTGE